MSLECSIFSGLERAERSCGRAQLSRDDRRRGRRARADPHQSSGEHAIPPVLPRGFPHVVSGRGGDEEDVYWRSGQHCFPSRRSEPPYYNDRAWVADRRQDENTDDIGIKQLVCLCSVREFCGPMWSVLHNSCLPCSSRLPPAFACKCLASFWSYFAHPTPLTVLELEQPVWGP